MTHLAHQTKGNEMDMLKEIERIEALAENKRDSVKLANFWKMYALEMRDEKNAEIKKLQTELQNWKDFCKKVQRQHLAEQPNVDVLVEALKFYANKNHMSLDGTENGVIALKALATYQAKNEKEL